MSHQDAYPHSLHVLCCGQSTRIHTTRRGHAASPGGALANRPDGLGLPVSRCFPLLQTRKLVLALDFTVVGSIFTGVGVKRHLEQDAQLPLSSVSVLK